MERALLAADDPEITVDELIAMTLETGKYGVEAMALLDKANTETYGNPGNNEGKYRELVKIQGY